MYFRTFFFILFIITSALFLFASFQGTLLLDWIHLIYKPTIKIAYIQLPAMFTSAMAIILFIITSYYAKKNLLIAIKKLERERRNIEQIHNELEALKK